MNGASQVEMEHLVSDCQNELANSGRAGYEKLPDGFNLRNGRRRVTGGSNYGK
jgi:hypothetical protein